MRGIGKSLEQWTVLQIPVGDMGVPEPSKKGIREHAPLSESIVGHIHVPQFRQKLTFPSLQTFLLSFRFRRKKSVVEMTK